MDSTAVDELCLKKKKKKILHVESWKGHLFYRPDFNRVVYVVIGTAFKKSGKIVINIINQYLWKTMRATCEKFILVLTSFFFFKFWV